jgi:hypothetical protein
VNWFKSFWKKLTAPPLGTATPARPFRPTAHEDILANFTPHAQQVLAFARKEADRFNHNFVGTEHLLLGLIRLDRGTAVKVLRKMGVDLESARREVEKQVGAGPEQEKVGNIPYTPRVKKVLALAAKEARALNHTYLGTEHLLLGMLREGDGVAARVFKNLCVDVEQTRIEILTELDPANADARPLEKSPAAISPKRMDKPLREPIDTSARYDVYCSERNLQLAVYRNVLIKSVKTLFQRHDHDYLSDFVELEQPDGQTIFIAKSTIVRLCKPGANLAPENLPGQEQ